MNVAKKLVPLTLAAVIGGGGGAAVALGVAHDSTTTTVNAPASDAAVRAVADDGAALSADDIYDQSKDSVVFITAQVTSQGSGPYGEPSQGEATGSGFVVSKDGYIATNAHVVEGATDVKVKIGDGEELSAEVVGSDASTDVALLKVDPSAQTLTPLTFADSSQLDVGDATYAIGNPYGLDRTLTTGVVSALQRQITAPNGYSIDDSSRPTPRSTRATPAARCSTAPAG